MENPATCNHQLPVTPPADHDSFVKGLFPPHTPHPLAQPVYGNVNSHIQGQPQSPSIAKTQTPTQQTQLPFPPIPGPVPHLYDRAGNPIDPRYVAMASRISAYYQQRCQAVANYQQQRCQQWANMQRQKCQDMMQAATMVVAWYIRDRIQRRRRRQKHHFRRGLTRKAVGPRPTKGETVRHWVLEVPSDVVSANEAGQEKLPDPEEADFTMDKESEPDKDTQLYRVADELIKSQVNKIDVPLMGMLEFDESESESESEDEEDFEYDQDEEEMDDYEDEDDECEDADKQAGNTADKHENMGSQEVQVSSGKNSRKRARSSLDS
ncbi:hypothetical protein CONLIGDRAFT_675829 [Coniochaeta ligniaria NRRL 30616]|uniref:Uncharacterized protein n=1 Tax=Coniochaeta ligniaria NRRL 30616 TaxID=1408157 RepID=A0A1J7J5X6_9PEZI|nr:hypothetical protein CONLIGDRAFT_675829 [Coniochaeta ligniaria NRRL 30616]